MSSIEPLLIPPADPNLIKQITFDTSDDDIKVNYQQDKSLVIKLPPMKAIFGISNKSGLFTLPLSFHQLDKNKAQQNSYQFFKEFENQLPKNDNFISVIRGEKSRYKPYLNLRLPIFGNGEFLTKVYYDNPKLTLSTPPECVSKGDIISVIIECGDFWESKKTNKNGLNWEVLQIKLTSPPQNGIYQWLDES